jgi:MoaA/NifB/PqqE/SkfB family radical SAM enzyme
MMGVTNQQMVHQEGLHRVIIEATNNCNLDCSICLRQSWNSELGSMTSEIFSKLTSDLQKLRSPPDIFFGGYGEPLNHPNILDMISQAAALGSRTALITNGTQLTSQRVERLIKAGLQKLWISVDGSHQNALNRFRSGEQQTSILDTLSEILTPGDGKFDSLEPGLSIVITRSNQADILDLLVQGWNHGLRSFFITNLEAYTPVQAAKNPYSLEQLRRPGSWRNTTSPLLEQIERLIASYPGVSVEGVINHHHERCPFAERGDLVLRWDGEISPCLPLLYDRTTYIGSWDHKQYNYSLGNILDLSISEIWADGKYVLLRERLLNREFSPCLSCRDCRLSEDNQQDCMGFAHPACGGCLWAEGLISCP